MNAPSLTRHLFLKDLRHQQAWLGVLWGYALLLPVMARLINGHSDSVMVLAAGGLFLLIFMMLGRLIRLDAPGREFQFLATRPIPWSVLLGEKTLFIGMLLLVPVWIAKLGTVFLLGIPVNTLDVVLILVENTLCVGALLAAMMLGSLFFRSLWVMFLSIFGSLVLVLVCGAYFLARMFGRASTGGQADMMLSHSRLLVFCAGIIVTTGAVAILRYRSKSFMKPLALTVVGVALSVLVLFYWPCDLGRLFPDKRQNTGELPSPLRDDIKFALLPDENGHGINFNGGSYNGVQYYNLNCSASLEGVEPPYCAVLVDYHSEATLKSGRTIRSSYDGLSMQSAVDLAARNQQEVAGFKAHTKWDAVSYEIFNYQPGSYEKEDLAGVSIKGVLTLEIRKLVVVKTMPFKAGGTVDMPRAHYALLNAGFNPGDVSYKILANSVDSTLRGDYSANGNSGELTWLVFNRSKGEYLSPGGRSSNSSDVFCNVKVEEGSLARTANAERIEDTELMPVDWADNAEISFFRMEPCGRISFHYEVKSVDLQR